MRRHLVVKSKDGVDICGCRHPPTPRAGFELSAVHLNKGPTEFRVVMEAQHFGSLCIISITRVNPQFSSYLRWRQSLDPCPCCFDLLNTFAVFRQCQSKSHRHRNIIVKPSKLVWIDSRVSAFASSSVSGSSRCWNIGSCIWANKPVIISDPICRLTHHRHQILSIFWQP